MYWVDVAKFAFGNAFAHDLTDAKEDWLNVAFDYLVDVQ